MPPTISNCCRFMSPPSAGSGGLESTKNLLYVLRRASSPCDNWGSYEPAPDSPTGFATFRQRSVGVGPPAPRASLARSPFVSSFGVRQRPVPTLPQAGEVGGSADERGAIAQIGR